MSLAVTHLVGFGAGGGFLPTALAGLEAWWRADLGITKDGSDLVATWADQSGNGRDLTEATNKPLWVDGLANGRPAVRFDGSNDRMGATWTAIAQPLHIFFVANQVSWTNGDYLFDGEAASDDAMQQASATPRVYQYAGSSAVNFVSPAIGSFALLAGLFDGASSSMALNNDAAVTGGNPGTSTLAGLTLGARYDDANLANIEVAEMAIFSAEIAGADLTNLKNYLNARYSLW